MALPQLIAAGTKALSSFFGGQDTAVPVISGGGTYAPGGINVGSKVVGSGSAATSQPSHPAVGLTSGLSGSGSAISGVPSWLPWAAAAVVILLVVSMFRRK